MHKMPLAFVKACEKYDPETSQNDCEMASVRPRQLDIPAQCPQCHFQASHNHFRALYGMTSFNIEHILSQLDRVDLVRDSLNGADLHARNALEYELQSLQQHTIRCAERFNANRDVAVQAFLGPLGRSEYRLHSSHMAQLGCWTGPSEVENTGQMQVPAYDDQESTSAALVVPNVDINQSLPADVPPTYFQLFPHKSEEPLRSQESQQNDDSSEDIASVSSDSHGAGSDHIEVLTRLIRKLEGELKELGCVPGKNNESMFTFTPEQMASNGSRLNFASQHQREQRENQVKSQLEMLRNILREEHLILVLSNAYEASVISAQIYPVQAAMVATLRERLCLLIDLLYGNRFQAGLGELLVPLNGTDPSSAHSITLLPGSRFAAKVTGFPQYVEGQLDHHERVKYAHLFDDLPEVLPCDAEVFGHSDPTVPEPEPDYMDIDHSPSQQLTEAALQSHNGDPPIPAQPTASYRMHARNIIFNMEQWPAELPDGYPDIQMTTEDGMPKFTPLLSPIGEQPRQHSLSFLLTPWDEDNELELEPGELPRSHPRMRMPELVSNGLSPEARSRSHLLSDARAMSQTLMQALGGIHDLLRQETELDDISMHELHLLPPTETPPWSQLEGFFTRLNTRSAYLRELIRSDDMNDHALVSDLLLGVWESSILMSRHAAAPERDRCMLATRDLQTGIRAMMDEPGTNPAP